MEKTGFCDVRCQAGLFFGVFLGFNFLGESATLCECAANFSNVHAFECVCVCRK